ncbi:MAG: sulfatase [Candidatus Eisenbacteria bacterium]
MVLIVMDALRPDYLGCYGCDRPTSPHIDDLARQGILFENAFTHASWTKPSFASLLTSLYPFQHGVVDWESVMPDTISTLPEVLRQNGYSTSGVINMLGITGEFKVTKGIDKLSEAPKGELNATRITDTALALIKNSSTPFFILIHYYDTHWPYKPPPEYLELVRRTDDPNPFASRAAARAERNERPSQEYIDRQSLLYAACVKYVDDEIGRLVESLDRISPRSETVVIITADHGEAFWEHGARAHGTDLYDEAIRVPLIIHYPARFHKTRRIESLVRHIDLMPTILELTGATDSGHREGLSLVGLIENAKRTGGGGKFLPASCALSELNLRRVPDLKSIRTANRKIIVEPATSVVQLYDVIGDPGETTNLWPGLFGPRDSLFEMVSKIPGASLNGWRVGLTGLDTTSAVAVRVSVLDGGRLLLARKVTAPGDVSLEVDADSSTLNVKARPAGLQILLFDCVPQDARITVEITARGTPLPAAIYTGMQGRGTPGATIRLDPESSRGLPGTFQQFRASSQPGAFVWWSPGEAIGKPGKEVTLTPEETKRLRALGYIQ